jgi:ketosteroid isomerase-like protein
VDRAAFLKQIAPKCAVSNLRESDVEINIVGDVAIVYARTTYGRPDGSPGAGRYTDVWQLRKGRWLCVSANVSRG